MSDTNSSGGPTKCDDSRAPETLSLAVIIATLGRTEQLSNALNSLQRSDVAPHEVLIVDGSEDASALEVTRRHASTAAYPVRHVSSPRGLTRQRNAGLEAAGSDVVLFLDDDAVVLPHAIGEVKAAYSDPTVLGATARIVEPYGNRVGGKVSFFRRLYNAGAAQGTFTAAGFPRRLQNEAVRQDIEFMQGAFMSARLVDARSIGFDELLPGYGLAEDEDFSRRLSQRGRIRYLGDVEIHHDNSGFSTRDRVAFARSVVRHRRYLFHKNFEQTRSSRAKFALLMGALVTHRLLNREIRAAAALATSAIRREELGLGPCRR